MALLALVWLLCSGEAQAGPLSDRLATFPNWTDKPPTKAADGDLVYPDWLAGTWELTSTLVDVSAPLAPDIQTPGFDSNQSLLNQPVICEVRFEPRMTSYTQSFLLRPRLAQEEIVADRTFNGLNLAKAYLGEEAVKKVIMDAKNPNRQLTIFADYKMLESTVTGRATEQPDETDFITTEFFQQMFRGGGKPYFNEVETTTAYHQVDENHVTADQITAVYLSPQEPNYFAAGNRPVALYRYQLDLTAIATPI
ncbi:MAG: hypothetical protein F6K00_13730 [Leptolyngbya sp. SIOISBB]|nr:hypothetical protein [Leptolyngbya sp. SIOISBB]